MKEAIMKDLNMLIETKGKASFCEERKSPKEVGSTVANSLERQKTQDTPCFQLGINEICIDLREFTLGQKEKASSSKRSGSGQEQPADISEFSMHNVFKESSSKRIKDKIMNSGKTKLK